MNDKVSLPGVNYANGERPGGRASIRKEEEQMANAIARAKRL